MDSFEPKKLALLRIWQIMQKYSDYDHPLTQDDIALHLESEREYASVKGYYAMAIFTLGSMTLYWVVLLINRFPDLQNGIENIPFVEIVAFPAMLFVISAIIAVLYFICAAQTRKDLKISD